MGKRRNVILLIAAAMMISVLSCDMGTMDQDDQAFERSNVLERVDLEDEGYVGFISPEPGIVFVSCVLEEGAPVPRIGNVLDYYTELTGEAPTESLVAAVGLVSEDEENIGGDPSVMDSINTAGSFFGICRSAVPGRFSEVFILWQLLLRRLSGGMLYQTRFGIPQDRE